MCLNLRNSHYNNIKEVETLIDFYGWTPQETINNGLSRANIDFKIKAMNIIQGATICP